MTLRTLTDFYPFNRKESFMTTATRKKPKGKRKQSSGPPRRKPVASRAAKPSENGAAKKKKAASTEVAKSGTDDDPDQKYIQGFEPVRDTEIEEHMEPMIDAQKQKEQADSTISTHRTQLTELLREKKLSSYRYKGYTAKFKPGDDTVQLAKPKQK
jgi:hypothetical protein